MKKTLLIAVSLLVFLSCQKDLQDPGIGGGLSGSPKLPATPVTGSVSGVVLDENDEPVMNAEVRIGNNIYSTNDNGLFSTQSLSLDKYISTVSVEKAGYFKAYRSFSANPTRNYVTIKLIKKTIAGTFNSNATGIVNIQNGSSITFQANAIKIKSTGVVYTGVVNVYAAYIDPTAADFSATVPGSLMAEDATNFYVLRSTGMLAVELESPTGEALQLIPTKPAAVKMAIPASLLSKAPTTIDTWSLDERGIWIKEGQATRNNNAYDMQVTHFSFWNCDVPMNAVYLTVNVKGPNNNNLQHAFVTLTSTTTFGNAVAVTDSAGNASGMVPRNDALTLTVSGDYYCPAVHTQQVGPFSSNSSINVITNPPLQVTYTVSATVNNCSGTPITGGSYRVVSGTVQGVGPITNGVLSYTFTTCHVFDSITLHVLDESNQQGKSVTLPISGNQINVGNIEACGTAMDEYINYTLGNFSYAINSVNNIELYSLYQGTAGGNTVIDGYYWPNYLHIETAGQGIGTKPMISQFACHGQHGNLFFQNLLPGATVTYTSYGSVGGYITGNFSAQTVDSASVQRALNGTFRLKRDF